MLLHSSFNLLFPGHTHFPNTHPSPLTFTAELLTNGYSTVIAGPTYATPHPCMSR